MIRKELKKYLKLVKIMENMDHISVYYVNEMFGYDITKSEELIQFFLNNVKKYDGECDLYETNMKSLGILEHVGGDLNLRGTLIEDLNHLKYVGANLWINHCKVESPGHLEYVGYGYEK